jgi:hypothetical protein
LEVEQNIFLAEAEGVTREFKAGYVISEDNFPSASALNDVGLSPDSRSCADAATIGSTSNGLDPLSIE